MLAGDWPGMCARRLAIRAKGRRGCHSVWAGSWALWPRQRGVGLGIVTAQDWHLPGVRPRAWTWLARGGGWAERPGPATDQALLRAGPDPSQPLRVGLEAGKDPVGPESCPPSPAARRQGVGPILREALRPGAGSQSKVDREWYEGKAEALRGGRLRSATSSDLSLLAWLRRLVHGVRRRRGWPSSARRATVAAASTPARGPVSSETLPRLRDALARCWPQVAAPGA